ncbi:hypothetical protein M422DRAFT_171145 [Sphaerobolus stellatus SS14]|uniref:Unplaced genomic scaffold SPHSTscaffold_55, whole genome shotgun sequence n=1 Tax=Sphaerobolus stellatus (strain SS14) TaxID=990650 RepID=A0A0C9VL15_SPHS4|nr:hypothetical protein M422DRAFT_171145 [Sphaerobolus stellatus SS14]
MEYSNPQYAYVALAIFTAGCILSIIRRSLTPFPPGPPPMFLIGNLRDFPTKQPWITYTNWKKKYGMLSFRLSRHVIVLNSRKAVQDLFEKRSHIYSDRPLLAMRDILGWKFVLGLMHYDDEWRTNRRILHQKYRHDAALAYRPVQLSKIHELLKSVLRDPENFERHYKYMAASIIMATVYGYESAPKDDTFIDNGDKAITIMTNSMFPGASLVNSVPFLKYLPSWVPGSQFQRRAEECQNLTRAMLDLPFEFVKRNMQNGTAIPSVISSLIQENGGTAEAEEMIKGLGATSYSGTSFSESQRGKQFLATHPDVCKRAQVEIDAVTSSSRLPEYEDRTSLPYVEAIYREVMRWRPAMPMGVAHTTIQDDIYEGYLIPRGATIMSNIWAMAHDPTKYSDPELFKPERFLTSEGTLNDDNTILTFGFGRRICIGRHAADSTIWATIACVLAVFNFSYAVENGDPVPISGEYTDALISHVLPFRCKIQPRSEFLRHLVEETK